MLIMRMIETQNPVRQLTNNTNLLEWHHPHGQHRVEPLHRPQSRQLHTLPRTTERQSHLHS
jgi:hypothetical protein